MMYDENDRVAVLEDLVDPDPEVRRLAVERIDALEEREALTHLVERLGDPDWRVRKSTVQRIASRPDPADTSQRLIEALADGENPGRRNSAVEALVEIGARAVPALVASCSDTDADVRKFVVDALAGIGSEAAIDALIGRLADADVNVRAAAADALGAVGGDRRARGAARHGHRRGTGSARCASRRCTRSTRSRSRCARTSSRACSAIRCSGLRGSRCWVAARAIRWRSMRC
jgi:HEAT repeat protein